MEAVVSFVFRFNNTWLGESGSIYINKVFAVADCLLGC